MATATRDLTVSKWSYVQEQYKTTHVTPNTTTWYAMASPYGSFDCSMLFAISAFPASLKHNKLIGAQFRLQVKNGSTNNLSFLIRRLASDFNASSVTWNTMPADVRTIFHGFAPESASGDIWLGTGSNASSAFDVLTAPSLKIVRLGVEPERTAIKTILSGGGTPYARIYYDDAVKVTSKIQYKSGPTSGYVNPRGATSFAWDYVKNGSDYCAVESWAQQSATFYWKKSTDGSYNAVSCGTAKGITIPANTFPAASTIQWYVSGTDEEGATTQLGPYSFSTAAGTAAAIAQSPIGSAEDASAPITFSWLLGSTDGQTPSRVVAQWKRAEDSSWTTLADISPAAWSYQAPAGTFPAGEIQWTVRAYNVDGTAGPWSTPESGGYYSFISIRAPNPVMGLTATPVPITTISWQSEGQEAYEIIIDGKTVRKAFGTDVYSWTVPEPLADGEHEISVRVQGVYGLWSQANSITVSIENDPPMAITLSGSFDVDAVLLAGTGETPAEDLIIHWYRDGKRIARTVGALGYTDRLSIGPHSYYAEIWDESGNYSRSNSVAGVTEVCGTMIALLAGGRWIDITLSDSSSNEHSFQWSRDGILTHVTGAIMPTLEMGSFEDHAGSYSCAFRSREDARAFEGLKGQPVIIKSRHENILVGALLQLRKRETVFYTAFSWTLQEIAWEDFVDEGD